MAQTETAQTPLMRQYKSLKDNYPRAILLFRLGDFYEMFYEDAKKASSVLGLVLTSRQGVPMCGVPYHAASNYISKLLAAGLKVAICEQTAPAGGDKKNKLFKREVVRFITPGTIVEDELLENKNSNYLASVETDIVGWGLSYIDASTGEFKAAQNVNDPHLYQLASMLSKLSPSEILVNSKTEEKLFKLKIIPAETVVTKYFGRAEEFDWALKAIWKNNKIALKTALTAISYIKDSQPGLKASFEPVFFDPSNKLQLDDAAIKTLELVSGEYDNSETLWSVLDLSNTAMGSRQLKRWLLEPLRDLKEILERQNFISFLRGETAHARGLAEILSQTPDIERALGRIINLSASPRDAAAVRKSLNQLPRLKLLLSSSGFFNNASRIAVKLEDISEKLQTLREFLGKSLTENPPVRLSDGRIIKAGYHKELDDLREIRKNTQAVLIEIEESEREKTRIPSLKIKYNSVFGYYIEVTKTHLAKIPSHYARKQTLVSAERFITPQLKEIESKILGAEERILKIELHLFGEIRKVLLENLNELRTLSVCLAELDAFYALSQSALKYDYVKPEIVTDGEMDIEEGRHPVVEQTLPSGNFVPNELKIGGEEEQIIILTGPNMSGKSVYLRQNALIAIMAQMGSFVPAKKATIPIFDRIMTRIGSQDRVTKGESTFMVEMSEVSSILNLATSKSLVILDEVGRGTSTFDGISIAWAIIEHLYKETGGAKVLFATHYFELTELPEIFSRIKNFNVSVKEWMNADGTNQVVFLHKIIPGSADKSYGIHVARLAGLPDSCLQRAKEILNDLENKNQIKVKKGGKRETQPLLPLFSKNPFLSEIEKTDTDNITPLEALALISKWKKEIKKNNR